MRPRNRAARDRLNAELLRNAPVSAAILAERLQVSVPTILRILKENQQHVVRIGTTKNARYALRRTLRGTTHTFPVYRIDEHGKGHECSSLELVHPHGSVMDLNQMGWPVDSEHLNGYWDGLPYPLYDMRPQGFLGRHFAKQTHHDLGLPTHLGDWSDDDIVFALAQRGSDTSGNLIIGDPAYERWLKDIANQTAPLAQDKQAEHYADMADHAMSTGIPASSAAGEFPKFTASRELAGAATPHVIVKFSGADNSSAVRRWSDLLVAEHIALNTLAEINRLPVAKSRILNARGRTFIEVERFDRIGALGRSEVVTLASIDGAFLGSAESDWPTLIQRLINAKLCNPQAFNQTRLLWWFGKLIANSDMHMGNLSFRFSPQTNTLPELHLAPAYDMLPMQYAPLAGGEIPVQQFEPNLPLPKDRDIWATACVAALEFWQQASNDSRISENFRKICLDNFQQLEKLAQLV